MSLQPAQASLHFLVHVTRWGVILGWGTALTLRHVLIQQPTHFFLPASPPACAAFLASFSCRALASLRRRNGATRITWSHSHTDDSTCIQPHPSKHRDAPLLALGRGEPVRRAILGVLFLALLSTRTVNLALVSARLRRACKTRLSIDNNFTVSALRVQDPGCLARSVVPLLPRLLCKKTGDPRNAAPVAQQNILCRVSGGFEPRVRTSTPCRVGPTARHNPHTPRRISIARKSFSHPDRSRPGDRAARPRPSLPREPGSDICLAQDLRLRAHRHTQSAPTFPVVPPF